MKFLLRKIHIAVALLGLLPSIVSAATKEVWVGAPLAGTWGAASDCVFATTDGAGRPTVKSNYSSALCNQPSFHHGAIGRGGPSADWSTDLPAAQGTEVVLFVAPQVANDKIVTKVVGVAPTCKAPTDCGYSVIVGIFDDKGTLLGRVVYAHLSGVRVRTTDIVNRWGTVLGYVGMFKKSEEWNGPHVHLGMLNEVGFSCFSNRAPGSAVIATNWLGFIGGNRRPWGPRQPCP